MLQEQQQQLQQMLGGLAETLKAVSTKIDDQTAVKRKAFADQKLSSTASARACGCCAKGGRHQRRVSRCRRTRGAPTGDLVAAARRWPPPPGTEPRPAARRLGRTGHRRPAPKPESVRRGLPADCTISFPRLHGRSVRIAVHGFQAHPRLPEYSQGRRGATVHRLLAVRAGSTRRRWMLPESDHRLPAVQHRGGRVYKLGLTYERMKQLDRRGRRSRRS